MINIEDKPSSAYSTKMLQNSTSKKKLNSREESKTLQKSGSKMMARDFNEKSQYSTVSNTKATNRNTATTSRDTIMASPKGILGNKISPRMNRS